MEAQEGSVRMSVTWALLIPTPSLAPGGFFSVGYSCTYMKRDIQSHNFTWVETWHTHLIITPSAFHTWLQHKWTNLNLFIYLVCVHARVWVHMSWYNQLGTRHSAIDLRETLHTKAVLSEYYVGIMRHKPSHNVTFISSIPANLQTVNICNSNIQKSKCTIFSRTLG